MVDEPHAGVRAIDKNVTYVTAGVKEVLTVDIGAATGGTWELTINDQSVTVDFDETGAALEILVETLSTIVAATVTGDGSGGDPWIITIDDPIKVLSVFGDGALLTPSDTLDFAETTPGGEANRLRPAVITALGAGDLVDLRVGQHAETYSDIDLLAASSDTDVWYNTSRRHP